MAFENTKLQYTPEASNPRLPWEEGIENIHRLLVELKQGKVDQRFLRPHIATISKDEFVEPPEMPAVDIRFVEALEIDKRGLGNDMVHEIWPIVYSIRYFHGYADARISTREITRNMFAIWNYLKYRNDLHGLCKTRKSKILGASQSETLFGTGNRAGFVKGGAIVLQANIDVNFTYYDGIMDRDVQYASGPRR